MKKALLVLSLGFAFMGTVGCASGQVDDIDDSSQAAVSAPADVPPSPIADLPQAEPIASNPAPIPPPPEFSEPPIAKSPSLGAASSGRGH